MKKIDIVIIMSSRNMNEIEKEAINMGINEKSIISCRIFELPNLDLKLYFDTLQNGLTVFANNC